MGHSPSETYHTIGKVMERLRAIGLDASPWEAVQTTAYTTASEWLGDLGRALSQIERQGVRDRELRLILNDLRKFSHR